MCLRHGSAFYSSFKDIEDRNLNLQFWCKKIILKPQLTCSGPGANLINIQRLGLRLMLKKLLAAWTAA